MHPQISDMARKELWFEIVQKHGQLAVLANGQVLTLVRLALYQQSVKGISFGL